MYDVFKFLHKFLSCWFLYLKKKGGLCVDVRLKIKDKGKKVFFHLCTIDYANNDYASIARNVV